MVFNLLIFFCFSACGGLPPFPCRLFSSFASICLFIRSSPLLLSDQSIKPSIHQSSLQALPEICHGISHLVLALDIAGEFLGAIFLGKQAGKTPKKCTTKPRFVARFHGETNSRSKTKIHKKNHHKIHDTQANFYTKIQ